MKKALRKDLRREIRNSRSRFISILVMSALSALFLTGLRSTGPDMKDAADSYFDSQQFMDIWVTSTLGLVDSDVEALSQVEGIVAAAGDWSLDAIAADGESEYTVKLHSIIPEGINAPTVLEGTLPEAAGECAVEEDLASDMGLEVGDVLELADTDTIEDALTTRSLTVTAIVNSPLYISIAEHGTSTLGDGSVEGFVLVSRDTITLDYYTEIYLLVDGAAELDTYDEAYETLISEMEDRVTPVAEELTVQRYESIIGDAQAEIDDAVADYEQEKQEAIDELDDAQAELDEAREEGEQEIADAEAEIADAEAEIADAEEELTDARAELDQGWIDLEDGRETYAQEIADAEAELADALAELESGEVELAESLTTLYSGEAEYSQQQTEVQQQLDEARAALEAADAQIAEQSAQLTAAQEQLETLQAQAAALEAMGDTENAAALQAQADALSQTLTAGAETLAAAQAETAAGWEAYETQAAAAQTALDEARYTLDAAWTAYHEGEQTLADGWTAYEDGLAELEQAKTDGQQELDDAETELNEGEQSYADGLIELEDARKELEDARQELEDARQTLEEEIADAQQEIDDAWAEAEEAFAEAEQEIADAEAELADVEPGTVYVLDRDSNAGYVTREQDSDRITSLGNVFPLLFYVVAVLVCLTTMTRMVEEKRTQIGALKALGYGSGAVAAEFLFYGLTAALAGSILGVAVGTKLIPYIVCTAYGVMYKLPDAVLVFRWGICAVTVGATLICILAATLWAVLSTMRETPASLMRPRAPRAGKRIFLEKIPFIWKHLNFSAKVAARNLLRYKKRFWMTIIGVGGCTALVITGLSLHSGLFAITQIQYDEISLYNLQVTVDPDEAGENLDEIESLLDDDARITRTMVSSTASVSWISDSRTVDGYLVSVEDQSDMEGMMVLRDPYTEEPITIPEDGVIMSLKLSELLGISAGDTITVELDDQRYEVTVSALCDQYVRHYVYMLDSYYESVFGESPADNTVYAAVAEDTEEAISVVASEMLKKDTVTSVTNVLSWANSFEETLSVVNIVVVVIILAAAALAFVVLYNLTNISITERLRELATIKVLGFFDGEVAMYVYRENIVLTLLGVLLGQPLGSLLYTYIIRTVEMDMVMFGRYSVWQAHLGSVGLTIVFALLVNFVMYFRLKKIDMVESLKSVE